MGRLDGKVAVITGAGTGIGRSCMEIFAREGAAVIGTGRRKAPLEDVAAAVRKAGGRADVLQSDAGIESEAKRVVEETLRLHGRIDVLVNNAGVFRVKKLAEVTPDHIAEVFGANMFGTIYMTLACMAALKKSRGTIINVSSSIAHQSSDRGVSIYGATKGGIEVFTRITARELAPEVRVNCISPGLMRSDAYVAQGMSQAEYDALLDKWAEQFPVKRTGEPEDFGELVAFLASPEKSGWMTGTIHILDGGRSLL